MKKIFIQTISLYQAFLSPFFKQVLGISSMCRFSPSCSEFAKQSIKKYGVLKGSLMGLKRLLSCQPFTSSVNHKFKITSSK